MHILHHLYPLITILHHSTHWVHLCIIVHPLVVWYKPTFYQLTPLSAWHSAFLQKHAIHHNHQKTSRVLEICGSGTILMSIIVGIDGLCLQTRNGVKFLHKHHWSECVYLNGDCGFFWCSVGSCGHQVPESSRIVFGLIMRVWIHGYYYRTIHQSSKILHYLKLSALFYANNAVSYIT